MLTQPSSPTYYARLQFSDAASCVDWLESIPLDDTASAHEMVSAQIGLLARTTIAPLERLRILEVLYQPAGVLQAELARRFIGRALPLSIVEYSIWNTVVTLWQALFEAYRDCLRLGMHGDTRLRAQNPLMALRTIDMTGAMIEEHHRVYREVPSALWAQLNSSYMAAEAHGLHGVPMVDPLDHSGAARTVGSAYASVTLAHLGNPYTMSPRQIAFMYRWAKTWSALISIDPSPPLPSMTSVLAVDLEGARPAVPASQVEASPNVRYLGFEQLGKALRHTLTLLREGKQPSALGLGEDCRQPGAERLLTLLYIHWCGAGMGQISGGRDRLEDARACVGLAAVTHQLESESETFRSGASAIRTAFGPLTEHWHVLAINAPGFVGVVRGPECDERIQHHQLVALKRRSSSGFQLGVTQWLKLEDDGDLSIGVRLWTGLPRLARLALLESGERTELNCLLLPAAPEARSPASIVLAPGVFRPGRHFEILSTPPVHARMARISERGTDFDRVVYELSDDPAQGEDKAAD